MTVEREDLEACIDRLRASTRDPRAGIFGPASKVWSINRESIVFLGGGRAALLQTAHPYVAHGVDQHSKTKTDPLGRFVRTFDNVFAMVYGDLDHAVASARRVHTIHRHITGKITERAGAFAAGSTYQANTEEALLWVHATLWDTSIQCYELIVRPLATAEKEAYYEETKRFAYLFGIPDAILPPTWGDFVAYNQRMFESDVLAVGRPASDIRRFLFRAPTRVLSLPLAHYSVLTAGLLPPRVREQFGFPWGRVQRATFESTVRALRASYRALPPSVRFLPAYREAMERLGEEPQGLVSKALNVAFESVAKRSQRRGIGRRVGATA